jgi:hypothetical protein
VLNEGLSIDTAFDPCEILDYTFNLWDSTLFLIVHNALRVGMIFQKLTLK